MFKRIKSGINNITDVQRTQAEAIKRKMDECYNNGCNDMMVIARDVLDLRSYQNLAKEVSKRLEVEVYIE